MFNVPVAVWCGTLSCYISFISAVILTLILRAHQKDSDDEVSSHQIYEAVPSEDVIEGINFTSKNGASVDSADATRIGADDSSQSISFSNITYLPSSFWLVCTLCILLYGTVVPFNTIASDFLMDKWYKGDIQMAGFVMRYLQQLIIVSLIFSLRH